MKFNNDSGSNYEFGRGQGFNGTFYNNIYTGQNYISLGNFPGSSASSTFYGVCEILIPEYAITTNYRQMLSNSGDPQSGAAAISWRTGTWKNTANAISSIQFTCELGSVAAGSVFSLYGMVGA